MKKIGSYGTQRTKKTTECPRTQLPGGRAQRRKQEPAGAGVDREWEEAILEEGGSCRTCKCLGCQHQVLGEARMAEGDCGRLELQRVKRTEARRNAE